MNTGLISVRYARALFEAAKHQKCEAEVYNDMQRLAKCYIEVRQLRTEINNPLLLKQTKRKLLVAVYNGNATSPLTEKFIDLVLKKEREDILQFIANAYITLYQKDKHIIPARLITASPIGTEQKERIRALVQKQILEGKIELETTVDSQILGGFVLDYNFHRMDASLRSQLRDMRKILEQT